MSAVEDGCRAAAVSWRALNARATACRNSAAQRAPLLILLRHSHATLANCDVEDGG